jgi:SAM-dependent methyltransferase
MVRLTGLFARRANRVSYAGVLIQWTVCRDIGGTYFRGVIEHDLLGRFDDGDRMSTGYVEDGPDERGMIRASDALYYLAPPAADPFRRGDARDAPATIAPEERSFAPANHEAPPGPFEASSHFELLYRSALDASGIEVADNPRILVFGCGSGADAVTPCLRLFRGARILATDRSERELAALGNRLRASSAHDRVAWRRGEPEDLAVEPGSFDLVTGASILHRLVDPGRALESAARALRPGGHAIFMEPFDGYGIIRLAFERIRAEADLRRTPLEPAVNEALAAFASNVASRTLPDPGQPKFALLEQKWLFSREGIAAAARNLGFAEPRFFAHDDHPSLYRETAEVILKTSTGQKALALPDWAWEILDGFDRALTPAVKRLLMLEASIVLTKGPDPTPA